MSDTAQDEKVIAGPASRHRARMEKDIENRERGPSAPIETSPRLEEFRLYLANSIPCTPDTEEVRNELLGKSLPDLVGRYLNWIQRYVPPRPRTVHFASVFWTPEALKFENAIYELAHRIRRGEDLTPFLSAQIHTHGYVPAKSRIRKWGDKDFALNCYEAHHLHLREKGSKELVYAIIARDAVYFVLLGNHKSFEDGSLEDAILSVRSDADYLVVPNVLMPEQTFTPQMRTRLARAGLTTFGSKNGKVVLSSMISTAGTSDRIRKFAQYYIRTLHDVDAKLDDGAFLKTLSCSLRPGMSDARWTFYFSDLCIAQRNGEICVGIAKGPL